MMPAVTVSRDAGDAAVSVQTALPRAFFPVRIIDEIEAGQCWPGITVRDDMLRIDGAGRTVIYRLTADPLRWGYTGEWPD